MTRLTLCMVLMLPFVGTEPISGFSRERAREVTAVEALYFEGSNQLWIRFNGDLDTVAKFGATTETGFDPNVYEPQQNWFICVNLVRRGFFSITSPGNEWLVLPTSLAADCGEPEPPNRVTYKASVKSLTSDGKPIGDFEIEVKVISS